MSHQRSGLVFTLLRLFFCHSEHSWPRTARHRKGKWPDSEGSRNGPGLREEVGSWTLTCHQFALAWSLGGQYMGHIHDPLLLLEDWVQFAEVKRWRRLEVLNTVEQTRVGMNRHSLQHWCESQQVQNFCSTGHIWVTWTVPGGSWCARSGGSALPTPLDSAVPLSQILRSALGWELSEVWTAACWEHRESYLTSFLPPTIDSFL